VGFNFMSVGPVNLGGGIIGSAVFLFLGHWVGQMESDLSSRNK
jgi:hypothetical protein